MRDDAKIVYNWDEQSSMRLLFLYGKSVRDNAKSKLLKSYSNIGFYSSLLLRNVNL